MTAIRILTLLAALAGLAAPALAQQAPAPAPAPPPAAAPAAPATPAAPVADEEVGKFARAALAVQKIQADTALQAADKQAQMLGKIKEQGLEPARFNEIAQAMQADTALQERVQKAVAAERQPQPAK